MTAKILQRDILCFLLNDEDFVLKTINESNIDLEKFPTSKVRQLAKKLESSKSTARHIKKVAGESSAAQINLLRHQGTEIPPSKAQRKQNKFRTKPNFKRENHHQANYQPNEVTKKKFNSKEIHQNPEDAINVGIPNMQKDFNALQEHICANNATNLGTSLVFATRNKSPTRRKQAHPKHIN